MTYIAVSKSSELYHHGVKGMRWGIRRYQDKTGALTDKGRSRYKKDVNISGGLQKKIQKWQAKAAKNTQKALSRTQKNMKYAKKALKLQAKGKMEKAGEYLQKQYDKGLKAAKFAKKAAKYQTKVMKNTAIKQKLDMSISEFNAKYGSKAT